jgi:2-haloacid dehalogenase
MAAGDAARWATFDCYGTLIDWNGGIGRELERLWGPGDAARLLHGYHEVEPEVERERPTASYRDVLNISLARLADRESLPLPPEESDALARSLPHWQPFPEVRASLEEATARGWRLVILSNTDRDFIEASLAAIGVPFECAIVASEIGSYKPARVHWDTFFERTGADPARHVHVAASLFHDVAPATAMGMRTVWVNRLGERPEPQPDVELHTLEGLADALDSLVA